jgi:hypothetical protein
MLHWSHQISQTVLFKNQISTMLPFMQLALTLFALLTTTFSHPTESRLWHSLAPIPVPRQEHTTVFLAPDTIAVLGGIIPSNSSTMLPIVTTPLMQFYSIESNTWTTSTPLPRAMNHINAAVVDGRIYVLGGLADSNQSAPAWRAVGDSFVYTPSLGRWETLPTIRASDARGSAAVGVYGSLIVLAGGMTDLELSDAGAQNSVDDVSIFDTKKRRWLHLPRRARRLPEARDHAGGAVVGEKMYVLGGRVQGQENIRGTVFVIDLEDLGAGWKISRARMPTPRGGVAAGVIDEEVYVFGGEGNREVESGVFDQIEAYDTVRDCWEDAGRMRLPRHGTYAVGVGERIYVPGGGILQSAGLVADFDVFNP